MASIEPAQLAKWFEACCGELVLYARHWLGLQQAEDVVQEAFVKLMSQRVRPGNVRAWLFRAVRNRAISELRSLKRRRRQTERIAEVQKKWFESHPDDLIDAETAQAILEKLPIRQREVVTLRIWGQMSLREIAAIVGSPVSTVHSCYQKALASIKQEMELSCRMKKT